MDNWSLIKGFSFLILGVLILLYEFKDRGLKQQEDATFKYDAVGGAIILVFLGIYYLIEGI